MRTPTTAQCALASFAAGVVWGWDSWKLLRSCRGCTGTDTQLETLVGWETTVVALCFAFLHTKFKRIDAITATCKMVSTAHASGWRNFLIGIKSYMTETTGCCEHLSP